MRLFITVEIPTQWRATVAAMSALLAAPPDLKLRLTDHRNTHLTLRFLGEVDEEAVPRLIQELQHLEVTPCELRLAAPGTFGPPTRPRVVWLGVAGDPSCLDRLAAAVDAALASAGLAATQQSWRPHLTLARVRERANGPERRAVAELVRRLPVAEALPFTPDHIALYRSHLGAGPPRYELLTSVRIG